MTIDKKERIAKVIAAAGICSRRDAEMYITDGRVKVNGTKLMTPAFTVSNEDEITVDGKVLPKKKETRLWIYHKPAGLVTTSRDPEGRPTVFEDIPRSLGRVISIGRLDLNSEGLLLLTNNGALSRHLELPTTGLPREYRVRVKGDIYQDDIDALAKGVTIDGIHYRGIKIMHEKYTAQGLNQWLRVILHEGKNREIRKVMNAMNLSVNRLIRTSYGPFELGNLEIGKVAEINPSVLKTFYKNIGFKEQ
jgi:23S rRNA pseudouridine2605 synthase